MSQLVTYTGKRPIVPLMLKVLKLYKPYFATIATVLGVVDGGKLHVVKGSGHVAKVKRTHHEIKKLRGTAVTNRSAIAVVTKTVLSTAKYF